MTASYKIKGLIAIISFTLSQLACAGGGTSANAAHSRVGLKSATDSGIYKVIPYEDYYESQALPPDIWARFSIQCNQTFLGVDRQEVTDPQSKEVTILIGALVLENSESPCSSAADLSVVAGKSFSGREFKILPLGQH
jgi:hypothetical protein